MRVTLLRFLKNPELLMPVVSVLNIFLSPKMIIALL